MNTMKRLRLRTALNSTEALTQGDVAKKLGVGCSAVSKWECGLSKPSVSKLPAIAKLYGCTIDELLADDTPCSDVPKE